MHEQRPKEVPRPKHRSTGWARPACNRPLMRNHLRLHDYAGHLDGLTLQGGADLRSRAYGEEPLRPEWSGAPAGVASENGAAD